MRADKILGSIYTTGSLDIQRDAYMEILMTETEDKIII